MVCSRFICVLLIVFLKIILCLGPLSRQHNSQVGQDCGRRSNGMHVTYVCTYMYCARGKISVVLNQNNHLRNTFSSFFSSFAGTEKTQQENEQCALLAVAAACDTDLTYDKLCHKTALQIDHRIIEQKYSKTKCQPDPNAKEEIGYQNFE